MDSAGLPAVSTAGPAAARLDAFGAGTDARSCRFADPAGVIVAERLQAVLPALARLEAAVAEGLHGVGYLAYEAAPAFDASLRVHAEPPRVPLLAFALFRTRIDGAGRAAAESRHPDRSSTAPRVGPWTAALSEAAYRERVERIRAWIGAGDTYQTNFTFRLAAEARGDPLALYHRLGEAQQAAYCAFLRFGDLVVLSASPELFFRWTADRLEMRPMKGTRPRGRWPAEDDAFAAELLRSEKERAENLMIVDLLRNDAGRVAVPGTVHVPQLFQVERYPTVHQMTSAIAARTRPGTTFTDLLRALFPSGSVSGAPKTRTMQIIAALEQSPRGVYTGAIGVLSPGEAVFSVAIRTLVLDARTGTAELGVGSGITWDADPRAEWRECLQKAAFVHHVPPRFQLLETLRYETGAGYRLLDEHLARLAGSAARFGFAYALDAVVAELDAAVRGRAPGVYKVRLLLGRNGDLAVTVGPLAAGFDAPACVRFADRPVNSADPLLFHKTTERTLYQERLAACPGCDDVILTNEHGAVTESTTANVVADLDGGLLTPPLDAGLLPGTLRAQLLRDGRIREQTLRPADLRRARAVYLINSVRGWRTAVFCGPFETGTPAAATCRATDPRFADPV